MREAIKAKDCQTGGGAGARWWWWLKVGGGASRERDQ